MWEPWEQQDEETREIDALLAEPATREKGLDRLRQLVNDRFRQHHWQVEWARRRLEYETRPLPTPSVDDMARRLRSAPWRRLPANEVVALRDMLRRIAAQPTDAQARDLVAAIESRASLVYDQEFQRVYLEARKRLQ